MKACGGEQAQGLCESWFGLGGVELVGAFRTLVLIEHVSEDEYGACFGRKRGWRMVCVLQGGAQFRDPQEGACFSLLDHVHRWRDIRGG